MKPCYIQFLIFALMIVSLRCSNDPDPRGAYVGSFEMEDFDVSVLQNDIDTTFTVTTNPDIKFVYADDLKGDELRTDMEEMIGDILEKTIGKMIDPTTGLSFEINDEQLAEVNGGEYETNEIDFVLTLTEGDVSQDFESEFSADGAINGSEITISFNITIYFGANSFYLSGSATGKRQ